MCTLWLSLGSSEFERILTRTSLDLPLVRLELSFGGAQPSNSMRLQRCIYEQAHTSNQRARLIGKSKVFLVPRRTPTQLSEVFLGAGWVI